MMVVQAGRVASVGTWAARTAAPTRAEHAAVLPCSDLLCAAVYCCVPTTPLGISMEAVSRLKDIKQGKGNNSRRSRDQKKTNGSYERADPFIFKELSATGIPKRVRK